MTQPRFTRDANGIPVLDEEGVEQVAVHFLTVVSPSTLTQPKPCPLLQIAERIENDGHCTFTFDEDLGAGPDGAQILGFYDIREKRIAVAAALKSSPERFAFTLAHELGHFYLHRRISPQALKLPPDARIRDRASDMRSYRVNSARPRSIMEWQANRFAAGILLPRATFPTAVVKQQREIGVTRRMGRVWLDDQPGSERDFRNLVSRLAVRLATSASVVRFRFFDLRLVDQGYRGRGPVRLEATLQRALDELFPQVPADA